MILFYFKEKPATPLCHGGKAIKKHMFQWKNLWKRKKMGKTYARCWRLGWEVVEVSLPLEEIEDTKREIGRKMLGEQLSGF